MARPPHRGSGSLWTSRSRGTATAPKRLASLADEGRQQVAQGEGQEEGEPGQFPLGPLGHGVTLLSASRRHLQLKRSQDAHCRCAQAASSSGVSQTCRVASAMARKRTSVDDAGSLSSAALSTKGASRFPPDTPFRPPRPPPTHKSVVEVMPSCHVRRRRTDRTDGGPQWRLRMPVPG